jgi:hypothetical protein
LEEYKKCVNLQKPYKYFKDKNNLENIEFKLNFDAEVDLPAKDRHSKLDERKVDTYVKARIKEMATGLANDTRFKYAGKNYIRKNDIVYNTDGDSEVYVLHIIQSTSFPWM